VGFSPCWNAVRANWTCAELPNAPNVAINALHFDAILPNPIDDDS
jgi:hypothetical protein